jgi:hypothetical protein
MARSRTGTADASGPKRWLEIGAVAVAGGLLAAIFVVDALRVVSDGDIGIDAEFYRAVGRRFIEEGVYYLPHQLAGPYDVTLMSDVLYPPWALFLFVPFAFLPTVLWWVVPLTVTAYTVWKWRPAWWGVATMLALLCWPRAHAAILFGNSDMWAMAGVAAALMWRWPAVFLTLKPTFAPLALIGIKDRRWWIALAVLVLVSLPMLPLWRDYPVVMGNLGIGFDYYLASLPLLAVPLVAWASRTRRDEPADGEVVEGVAVA